MLGLTCISVLDLSHVVGAVHPQPLVVAQRSQLSKQYHAKPERLRPNATMTENVTLNGPADYFSVQIHAHSVVAVTLTKQPSSQTYHLTDAGAVYRLHHPLEPGQYQITVRNQRTTSQAVDVVRTAHYQLSAFPLEINGTASHTASLIYTSLLHVHGRSING